MQIVDRTIYPMSTSSDPKKKLNFAINEQVLCYHGPMIYEAKVLNAEYWEEQEGQRAGSYYFVHYKGWKDKWDEWVPESRVMKFSPENLAFQAELGSTNAAAAGRKGSAKKGGKLGTEGKRKVRDSISDDRIGAEMEAKELIELPIPPIIKNWLIDEWESITKQKKLLTVPCEPSVTQIIDAFRQFQLAQLTVNEKQKLDEIEEVLLGLKSYFDAALGLSLLYRFERTQYAEVKKLHPKALASDLYGAEHLLRLLIKMPEYLEQSTIDQETADFIISIICKLIDYLSDNFDKFYSLEKYCYAADEYVNSNKTL